MSGWLQSPQQMFAEDRDQARRSQIAQTKRVRVFFGTRGAAAGARTTGEDSRAMRLSRQFTVCPAPSSSAQTRSNGPFSMT